LKKAFITGISGQDGSYLAELLLSKGYEVHGLVMRSEIEDPRQALWRLANIMGDIRLYPGSIESYPSLLSMVNEIKPDECYHLAATSFVSYAFEDEYAIFNSNISGTHNVLSVLKQAAPECRFYFAGSSELFGRATVSPQNETTPFNPRSAYGITKATGFYLTCNYRENFHMFACNGILYNHESPRRGFEYVTRKVTYGAARIKLGFEDKIVLGNLDAVRDWGFAGDYVKAMWQMLQRDQPRDYVVATGQAHSIRDLCDIAFSHLDLNYRDHITTDKQFYRPTEDVPLIGDATRARTELKWEPSVSFSQMIEQMVDSDYALLQTK
jgi:GDPmannose 4,6-dehydratase